MRNEYWTNQKLLHLLIGLVTIILIKMILFKGQGEPYFTGIFLGFFFGVFFVDKITYYKK